MVVTVVAMTGVLVNMPAHTGVKDAKAIRNSVPRLSWLLGERPPGTSDVNAKEEMVRLLASEQYIL